MKRQDAIAVLARHKGDCISVATMQAGAPWKDAGKADKDHLDAAACMGSASSLGLGIALGRPDKKVMVLDGDGSLLMQLGTLVTAASLKPANYLLFVFGNGTYESSGNQPIPGVGVMDFRDMAKAAGFPVAENFADAAALDSAMPHLLKAVGPVLVHLEIDRELGTPRWPGASMAGQIQALRERLAT